MNLKANPVSLRYNRAEAIDYFVEEITADRLSFSDVRKQLEQKRIAEEEINIVVKQVDKLIIRRAEKKASRELGLNLFIGGIATACIGVAITACTYLGVLDMGDGFLLLYGPLFSGVSLAAFGWTKMKG